MIRPGSLSSVANRFIEVHLPSASAADAAAGEQDMLEDGAVIQSDRTTSVVEIDTFFSMFDKKTRESIQGFFRGGRRQYAGVGDDANRGLPYLKTNLSASSRLFRELTYDPPVLERFLMDSSRLVTALAEKEGELSPLVNHLNRTTRALGIGEGGARGAGRAAARLHANRELDLREPARGARRRRSAGRGVEARGAQAGPVPRRAAAVRERGHPDDPRPRAAHGIARALATTCSS